MHYTTNSSDLGFTVEATQQLLTNSCARLFLIIISDTLNIEASYNSSTQRRYYQSAYYQAITQCCDYNSYINLIQKEHYYCEFKLLEEFEIANVIKSFHSSNCPIVNSIYLETDGYYSNSKHPNKSNSSSSASITRDISTTLSLTNKAKGKLPILNLSKRDSQAIEDRQGNIATENENADINRFSQQRPNRW